MTRLSTLFAAGALLITGCSRSTELESVEPQVMLLVDTSGSMEKALHCACTTPECAECLPTVPTEPNRWATILEALTGEIRGYEWEMIARDGSPDVPETDPDYGYYIPHFRALSAEGGDCDAAQETIPGATAGTDDTLCQVRDGVLDTYRDRVRFGLMTFDTVPTRTGEAQLMSATEFEANLGQCAEGGCTNGDSVGGYSYGGPRTYAYPGSGGDRMIDVGARREGVPGGLVSFGDADAPPSSTNVGVQRALLDRRLRPVGPTPSAGLFSDLRYYLENHPDVTDDPEAACRPRVAIFITDGPPNQDMRGVPIFCDAESDEARCPYDRVEDQVVALLAEGFADEIHVIAFDMDPADCAGEERCERGANDALEALDTIGRAGDPGGTRGAHRARDEEQLRATLASILDQVASTERAGCAE